MNEKVRRLLDHPNVRATYRIFVVTTLVLFIPGLLGWLNDLMEWADSEGKTNFPDIDALAYLVISAVIAGCVASINLAWHLLEDFMQTNGNGHDHSSLDQEQ